MKVAHRQVLVVIGAAAVLAAVLAWAFWPRPVPVDLAEIGRGPLTVTVDGEGKTRVRETYLVSAPLPGRVLRIDAEVGDAVTAKETVLATVRPTDPTFLDVRTRAELVAAVSAAEAARALAEAERARAEADLGFAKSDLERFAKLAKSGTVSPRELERAELDVATKLAEVARAEAALEMRRHELATAKARLIDPGQSGERERGCCVEVKAPVDGRVLAVLHESEGVVDAGAPLLEIGDISDLEVVVDLLSTDAVQVTEGGRTIIEDWGGGEPLEGIVRRIEPTGFTKVSALGIEEQRVNVLIDFAGPEENWQALGHGYRVEVRVVTWSEEDVVRVPLSALFRSGKDWAVFVADDGLARLRTVVLGKRNGRFAQVLEGLEEGEAVVVHPSDRVADGIGVVPREEGL